MSAQGKVPGRWDDTTWFIVVGLAVAVFFCTCASFCEAGGLQ